MRVALTLSPDTLPRGLSRSQLSRLVRESATLALPKVFGQAGRGVQIEVALVSDRRIQTLNRMYRNKDQPTDVLSFGTFSSPRAVARARERTIDLGTLILSLPTIRRAAREDGVSWEREFAFVFSHGVLHLLGFDHEERMFAIQDEVTDRLAPSPYKTKNHV